VHLSHKPGEIQLQVSDQGRGIKPEIQAKFLAGKSSGVGLRGMRERVRQLRGGMQIQSSGNGTSVMVFFPLGGKEIASDELKDSAASPSQKAG
jgi:signal transduction histidine kinase